MSNSSATVAKQSLCDELNHLVQRAGPDGLSLRDLASDLSYRGHALICVLLSLPFLFPVPLPGLSTVVGVFILAASAAIVLNVPPWLPFGLAERRIPRERLKAFVSRAEPWLKKIERFLRPRLVAFSAGGGWVRVHGAFMFLCAALLALPSPPGGNVLPALAIIAFALGLIEEDGVVIGLAYVLTLANVALFSALFFVLAKVFSELGSKLSGGLTLP